MDAKIIRELRDKMKYYCNSHDPEELCTKCEMDKFRDKSRSDIETNAEWCYIAVLSGMDDEFIDKIAEVTKMTNTSKIKPTIKLPGL